MNTPMLTEKRIEDLKEKASALMEDELPKANIIVAGVSGAGKSTLLNAIFGQEFAKTGCGRPITSDIRVYEDKDNENALIRIWDTMGFELNDKQVANTVRAIKDTIAQKNESEDPFDRIHAIWYCIQATGGKFQETESKFIKELHSLGVPFIIVMTKCISKRSDEEFERIIKELLKQDGCSDISIVRVLAKEWEIDDDQVIKPKGLDDLVNLTLNNLESYVSASFIAAQTATKANKRELAEACIWKECDDLRQKWYKALPIANIFAASSHMEKMFKAISRIYNANLTDSDIKEVYKNSAGEWKGKMANLINPLGNIAFKKADEFYNKHVKGQTGFNRSEKDIKDFEWAAKLILWSGYSWIFSIEAEWEELINADAEKRDAVIKKMIARVKKHMNMKN